jgi:protein N-lysine methyltransferase METTL21D
MARCPVAMRIYPAQVQQAETPHEGDRPRVRRRYGKTLFPLTVLPHAHAHVATGLVSLTLAALGVDVTATDLPEVINTVLDKNMEQASKHLGWGRVNVKALDWLQDPSGWVWDDAQSITAPTAASPSPSSPPDFELIVTSDTVYASELSAPLLRTISHLCAQCDKPPLVLLAIERRDPNLVDEFLRCAEECFKVSAIDVGKLAAHLGWEEDDWIGTEVYQLKWRKRR